MSKIKIFGLAGGCLVAAGLAAALFIVLHNRNRDDQTGQHLSSSQTSEEVGAVDGQSGGSNSIPLNPAGPAPNADSGLSVGSSSAASRIGQLDGSSRTQSRSPAKSNSPPYSGLDPATFADYEKYKDSKSALFGDIEAGTGAELTANHRAAVFYRGWLTNGQLFDESRQGADGKLQPFVFTLGVHQVIPGWEQALNGMKAGGTRLVIIPPEFGYGASGQGAIPPNSVLIFQVQLAAVE